MRVTNNMVSGQTVFNLQRSLDRFMQLQNNESSGRRINVPSDDPGGTVKDLSYRTELANITQYQKNIGVAQTWTSTYDSILSEVNGFVSNAKEIAVAMSNATYDASARQASANEIQSLFDQMIQLGNSQLADRQIFSGYQTKTKPFAASAKGVTYAGDNGTLDFEIEASQKLTINLNGSDVFLKQLAPVGEKSDLNVAVTNATLLADLNAGTGVNLVPGTFTVTDRNRGISATVDLTLAPAATTVGDVIAKINAQLTAAGITNVTAAVDGSGTGIALKPIQDGIISGNTLISKINGGVGLDLTPGTIRVSNGAGYDFIVDLSGSVTISDVMNKFNAAMTAQGISNVTMTVNAAGTGLRIDDTNAIPLGLGISEVAGTEQTAANLGIIGAITPTLAGTDLHPLVDFEVKDTTGTTAKNLGIVGQFSADFVGTDLDPKLTLAASLKDLRAGSGIDAHAFTIYQGNSRVNIDLSVPGMVTVQDMINAINNSGLTITASINAAGTGVQIVNNDPTKSMLIEDSANGRSAKDLGVFGSTDIMGTMLILIDSLKNNDQQGTSMLLGNLDNGMQSLLNTRAVVGARGMRLTSTNSRLSDLNLNFTKLLSETEDADLTKVTTDLATYANNYQAALNATARIIQPSLLDFLK
jgi:flagellar hook-associated protein 3